MAKQRKRVKRGQDLDEKVYDRRASDLPFNAVIVPATVDDPYKKGDQIKVFRSVRDDPLYGMFSRDQIDKAQLEAGRRWQREYESAEIEAVRAIDPTKEPVDGHGPSREPFNDRQAEAFREIAYADEHLGREGGVLIRDILARRMTISQAAAHRGFSREIEINYIGRRFRECLDTLARLWGYAG